MPRLLRNLAAVFATALLAGGAEAGDFATWLAALRAEAAAAGISEATLDAALTGIRPRQRIIALDRRQPEGRLSAAQYLERVVPQARKDSARQRLAQHRSLLESVAARYRVQPRFIVALWGIETDFGRNTGGFGVIEALATLAFDGRRSDFFRGELLAALRILEDGHIAPEAMRGSWAGAMGQSQFMPSSFLAYAVDEDGDGRHDIWTTLPDIFASIANYLARSGWRDDQTWGRAVTLPPGFSAAHLGLETVKPIGEWQALGVRRANRRDLPARQLSASILRPDGDGARAYMVYDNFSTVLEWNRSIYFALAVGHLADAMVGH